MVEKDAHGGGLRCTGIVGELLNYIKQARNTTYTLVEEPNGVWGNCEHATNCSGMIGMVNRKEVDLALGMLKKLFSMHCNIITDSFVFRTIYHNSQQAARC